MIVSKIDKPHGHQRFTQKIMFHHHSNLKLIILILVNYIPDSNKKNRITSKTKNTSIKISLDLARLSKVREKQVKGRISKAISLSLYSMSFSNGLPLTWDEI